MCIYSRLVEILHQTTSAAARWAILNGKRMEHLSLASSCIYLKAELQLHCEEVARLCLECFVQMHNTAWTQLTLNLINKHVCSLPA